MINKSLPTRFYLLDFYVSNFIKAVLKILISRGINNVERDLAA
jgi:hypothetical protein